MNGDLTDEAFSSFKVYWWNGGGALLKRLKVNPGLGDIINQDVGIFVNGETENSNQNGLFLKGYHFIFHR